MLQSAQMKRVGLHPSEEGCNRLTICYCSDLFLHSSLFCLLRRAILPVCVCQRAQCPRSPLALPCPPTRRHRIRLPAARGHGSTATAAVPSVPPCADAGAIPAADQASWARGSPSGATGSPPPPTRRVRPCCRSAACPCPCPCPSRPGPAPHGPFAPVERSTRVAHAAGLPPHQRLHCRVRHGAGRRGEGRVLPLCLSFFFSLLPLPRFLAEEARLRVPSSRGSHAAARVQRHAAQPDGLRPAGGDQRQRAPIHPLRL